MSKKITLFILVLSLFAAGTTRPETFCAKIRRWAASYCISPFIRAKTAFWSWFSKKNNMETQAPLDREEEPWYGSESVEIQMKLDLWRGSIEDLPSWNRCYWSGLDPKNIRNPVATLDIPSLGKKIILYAPLGITQELTDYTDNQIEALIQENLDQFPSSLGTKYIQVSGSDRFFLQHQAPESLKMIKKQLGSIERYLNIALQNKFYDTGNQAQNRISQVNARDIPQRWATLRRICSSINQQQLTTETD